MSGIRSIINKFASQTSPPGSTGPPMNHVSGPGMPAGARSPCINCQANPATPGFQFCSKQCAHAYSGQGPPTHHQGPPGSNQPPGPGHGPGPAGTTNTIFILAPIVANCLYPMYNVGGY
ncbi:hypothetical protein M408DRAFT_114760 [Serendipita vermifera MAFF 305830]|uniref:Uncharacterized protein n=1 Tax=Serendipita vermifera MAFF 305830 TaxID=933852 RepID=A0A0C2WTM6_SERVB|nr:hypothetical protein M408DRAFT_114760 [Serendipita vermifera MAFF 305830]